MLSMRLVKNTFPIIKPPISKISRPSDPNPSSPSSVTPTPEKSTSSSKPWCVYLILSTNAPIKTYVGSTNDFPRRLRQHNGELKGGAKASKTFDVLKTVSKSEATMDFSPLSDVLASKSYDKISDVCDQLMLKFAAEGVSFQDEWPYAIHILGHIYVNDINSARFLWKSVSSAVKENQPEVVAVWTIGQRLWTRDYAGVHEAIRGFDWSQETGVVVAAFSELYTKMMFQLLLSAYSTISIHDTALFLGMNEDDATHYVVQQGWIVDTELRILTVKNQPVVTEQKLDSSKLQRLTEYVFYLEH